MRKNNLLILLTSLLALTGCATTIDDDNHSTSNSGTTTTSTSTSTSSGSTDSVTSSSADTSSSTSSDSSSTSGSTTSSTTLVIPSIEYEPVSIAKANQYCDAISASVGDINTLGDKYVEVTGKFAFVEPCGTTAGDYRADNQYKVFLYDDTGYIYIGINDERYNAVFKKKQCLNSYYKFRGIINKYLGTTNEIIMGYGESDIKAGYTWLEGYSGPEFNTTHLANFAGALKTMDEIFKLDQAMYVNIKGTHYGSLVAFKGQYVEKVENAVALFANGKKVMKVHGHGKLNNAFSKPDDSVNGDCYTIYGVLTMFKCVPEIEYVDHVKITEESEKVSYDVSDLTTKTGANFWQYTYDSDNEVNKHNSGYAALHPEIWHYEGYVHVVLYSGKYNFALCDTEGYTNTYLTTGKSGTEKSKKALRLNNSNETEISSEGDLNRSVLYNYLGQRISINLVAYSYNTSYYWQVEAFDLSNIQVLS